MDNQYKRLYDSVKTPENWKLDIKEKMKAEQAKNDYHDQNENSNQNINSGQNIVSFSNAKKKSKKIYYFIPAVSAAALLCLVLLISSTNNKITLDEEKSAVAQIDQFTKENHNVCVVDKGELLEDDALFGTFSDETVDEDNSTTEVKSSVYAFENGGNISIVKCKKNQMPKVDKSEISQIDGVNTVICLYHRNGEEIYVSYIDLHGEVVQISCENMNKEDVIYAIWDYISKNK